jgi:putative hydrolase of the HAD superfamily
MSHPPARIDTSLRATAPRYKAITFDVGGTLIEPWPSVGHVYAEVAGRHGMTNVAPEKLNRRFAEAWQQRKDFRHTRAEWRALVEATFNASMSSDFFSDLYEEFGKAGSWRIFEDVSPALDSLASHGIKLGVISNWDERLRPLLGQFELYDRFDAIIVSNEVGFPKPSQVIFRQAAESLG